MSANNTSAIILIQEGVRLPPGLVIETELFLPGWRVVRNLDSHALARKIEKARWNFFYLAGAFRTTVIGRERPGTLRRAVKRALAMWGAQSFNSFHVTKTVSRRFLGIPFLSITAHSRHIQEGMSLVPARDFVLRTSVTAPDKEVATKQFAAVSSGS